LFLSTLDNIHMNYTDFSARSTLCRHSAARLPLPAPAIWQKAARYLGLLLLVCWATLAAAGQTANQQPPFSTATLERELARAEALLTSFKNDSARIIAVQVIEELTRQQLLDTPLGLRAQLDEAIALEQDQNGEQAIAKLLWVVERCREKSLWDLSAKATLNLALLYEGIERGERSLEYLQETKGLVDQHRLDSIYPYYAIRMSSWQRIYGDKDSALYYAREALRTAPQFQLDLEEAIGHMLMNMLLPKDAVAQRLEHSFAAVQLYRKLEDYTGCSYMLAAIASLYHQENDLPKALLYNDSTLLMANLAIAQGHEKHPTIASAYRFRGEIYGAMGQLDSAWANVHRGYRLALDLKEQDIRDKIIAIDARYNDELKQKQLDEQTLELKLKNTQLRSSALVGILVLLLAAGLAIGLYQQRQGKRQLAEQNALITGQSEQIKTLDAAKSRFFANVSHELRTPLTLMLGPVRTLLKENQLTEKQARLLQAAHRSGMELQELVNEILDLHKLEMGKLELRPQPTVLVPFFRNSFAQFDSLAQRKDIAFSSAIHCEEGLAAEIDQAKCRQLVNNLLSNAFKFTPQGGQVSASLSLLDGEKLELAVTDSGPGIHPDDLPHVFDRFFQTSRPDKPAEGGTGIGLALCREYARLFEGHIEVESTLGQGAMFRIVFPVVSFRRGGPVWPLEQPTAGNSGPDGQVASADSAHPALLPSNPAESKPTILVVEDNPDLQDYIRLLLESRYHVIVAENGQAALDYLLPTAIPLSLRSSGMSLRSNCQLPTANCQLILSDLMMPIMDGYQLLEKLKSDDATRHIPVVMLTARAEARDKLKALRIGVDDYLTKPFEEEELLARIENLLRNQAARQAAIAEEPAPANAAPPLAAADREWLERFEAYVQQHLSSNILSVPLLADAFAMSESTLLRQLKRLTGLTPMQYLLEMRLDQARRMLESGTYRSVGRVAAEVGYQDTRSFARSFKNRFGKLPSEL
jgi:signal transduction histidine kinase/DNA-binding response OmpR family regulator